MSDESAANGTPGSFFFQQIERDRREAGNLSTLTQYWYYALYFILWMSRLSTILATTYAITVDKANGSLALWIVLIFAAMSTVLPPVVENVWLAHRVRDRITREFDIILVEYQEGLIGPSEAIQAWKQVKRVSPEDRIYRELMSTKDREQLVGPVGGEAS